MKIRLLLISLLIFAGCVVESPNGGNSLEKWIGSEVTVYFRRDMLGAAGSPIAPTSTWLNNTKVSLSGKIVSAHDDGIYFDSHYKMNSSDKTMRNSIFWIPSESILLVEQKQ